MFRRVLIANRGEIAARIARGCRAVGAGVVMVYSEADAGAPWLELADETLCLGPARANLSYLATDSVLQAAIQLEAQAVHPGYGFLSENASFAARCEQQGLRFVGPTASAIARMGDKSVAKATMRDAGLPTIPGSDGAIADVTEARTIAEQVGYPVLLKASAGGGGKGMRRCESEAELEQAFGEATLEADKAFGDPSLYLEKVIQGGRHVEFQLICDHFGRGVHLGERECSIQRKHQKLIEESPSPAISEAQRAAMGQQVADAAAELGYRNAGTVEFLLDRDGSLYFMEMNTRLQVEHPVTEAVTGVDIVAEQLRVAANCRLSIEASPTKLSGHAIEFRINAEDPEADFRPDPGQIERCTLPAESDDVRWDAAIVDGYRIPPHYDSMIGKLIVHAPDRRSCMDRSIEVLDAMEIEGVRTTLPLHRKLLRDEIFRSGDYDVTYLERSGILSESS